MQQPTVIHNTFVLERHYPATPERVFDAFADPVKKRRWFIESGHSDVEHFEMDFRTGGKEDARVRFKQNNTPVSGLTCANDTRYLDIIANRRLVFASAMAIADHTITATLVTIELLPSGSGTDLILTHQGAFFEGADGPEMRKGGWEKLMENLAAELAR